ncbi:hypothetical protein, partial [Bordetella trematum]|uniref:hypothetical protein n=1 Tax=Bordetella trematum TaxID=123899 RepID=UPI003D106E75
GIHRYRQGMAGWYFEACRLVNKIHYCFLAVLRRDMGRMPSSGRAGNGASPVTRGYQKASRRCVSGG